MTIIMPPKPAEDEADQDHTQGNPACPTCRFFQKLQDKPVSGACHVQQPTPCIYGMGQDALRRPMPLTMAFWPSVGERDWCGKHEPIPPKAETSH